MNEQCTDNAQRPSPEQPYMEKLTTVYGKMDQAYSAVADAYGFQCRGCDDNCCMTRFYHHTWVEYYYLEMGVLRLSPPAQSDIRRRAREVCRKLEAADHEGRKIRVMCPLNKEGLCTCYEHRPMICRLHGIPHELHSPTGDIYRVPGCGDFTQQCGEADYIAFNRTPLYLEMARLEQAFRDTFNLGKKERATIAEMVLQIKDPTIDLSGNAAVAD